MQVLNQIPTSKNRRILQAIKLGQRVTEKEQELLSVIKERDLLQKELHDTKAENQGLQNLMQVSKSPGSYMVRTIEEKEKEIIELKKQLYQTKNEAASLRSKLEFMNEKFTENLQK